MRRVRVEPDRPAFRHNQESVLFPNIADHPGLASAYANAASQKHPIYIRRTSMKLKTAAGCWRRLG